MLSNLFPSQLNIPSSFLQMIPSFLDVTEEGFIILNSDQSVILINKSAKSMLGNVFNTHIIEGDKFISKLPEDKQSVFLRSVKKALMGIPENYEVEFNFQADTFIKNLFVRFVPVKDENGEYSTIVLNILDITKQKKAEKFLLEANNRIKYALQNLGDDAWGYNFSTGESWYSSDPNNFTGYSAAEFSDEEGKQRWWKSIHEEDRHLLIEIDKGYMAGLRSAHNLEYRVIDRFGKMRWVLDRGVVIEKSLENIPISIVGTHVDITELKEMQINLANIEDKQRKEAFETVIKFMENDRKEIATELHENISQVLTAARMMVEFLPAVNKEMEGYNDKIKDIIHAAVDEVNKLCHEINPDSLTLVSITSLIQDLVSRLNKEKPTVISYDFSGYDKRANKNEQVELTILRAAQESLYRITHFTKSKTSTIKLYCQKKNICVDVTGDDRNIKLTSLEKYLSIQNLVNRCEHFGGSFSIASDEVNGINFSARIPY
jgi:PAS domain S-box-containing protein